MNLNRKGLALSIVAAAVCAAAVVTLVSWPPTNNITWKPLTAPAWWQFEWLAGVGVLLSALPSLVIAKLDAFFAGHESLRNPVVSLLIFIEVAVICFCVYRLVARAFPRQL